jgi:beta-N-acetylglucosaminidase
MNIKDFVNKYWFEAIKAEKQLNIPAMYLLAHVAIETKLGEQKSINYIHGEEIVVLNNIKDDLSNFKKFWIDLYYKIKSWFKKPIIESKEIIKEDIDYTIDFLINSKYSIKLHYIQNLDLLAETLYDDKQQLIDIVEQVKQALIELKHI